MARLPAALRAAALLLALACAAAPALAKINFNSPEGPSKIVMETDAEFKVTQQVLAALTAMADRSPNKKKVVIASEPPAGVNTTMVAQAIGVVLAAAAVEDKVLQTLGDPFFYP